jgi:phosphate-selective porin OprO/OprP
MHHDRSINHRALGLALALAPSLALAQSAPLDQPPHAQPLAPTDATRPQEATTPARAQESPAEDPNRRLELHGAFGRGYTIRTPDERFSLTLRARIQGRVTLEHDPTPSSVTVGGQPFTDPFRAEFTVRRARIVLSGNAYTRAFQYYLQLGLSPQDMESDLLIPLRDAYVTWTPHAAFSVRAGQMKVPFSRQRVISSGSLQFVDRAGANAELNLDRDIGVQLRSDDVWGHRLGYSLGVFGGNGRGRPLLDAGLLYVARVQLQPLGRFEDMDVEGDLRRGAPRLSIGIAGAYNQRTPRAQSTLGSTVRLAPYDYLHATADVMFKWRGFSLQSEGLLRVADRPGSVGMLSGASVTEFSRSAWGYMVQASYQTASHLEVGARWSEVTAIDLSSSGFGAGPLAPGVATRDPRLFSGLGLRDGTRASHELGAVFSYYLVDHSVKFQTDAFYLFGDDPGDGRLQLRLQAQLAL